MNQVRFRRAPLSWSRNLIAGPDDPRKMLSVLTSPLGFATMSVETNPCKGGVAEDAKPAIWKALGNTACENVGKVQSGADVTFGAEGTMTAALVPITSPFDTLEMCAPPLQTFS